MRSAVVTGANGFVGQALLRELARAQIPVSAVIRSEASNLSAIRDLPNVEIVFCDMDRIDKLPQMLRKPADVFYHLAWEGASGTAREDWKTQLQNVRWTLNAAAAAKAIGCEKFIGAGTTAEWDADVYMQADGAVPPAMCVYGAAKITAHYMSRAVCGSMGLAHIWACLSNTYGPGDPTSNFINFAAKTMLTGQPPNFTSGEQSYDFTHISDIAQGLYKIGRSGKSNHAYYIGSAAPRKLKEYIKIIRDEIDPSISVNLGAVPWHGAAHPMDRFDCSKLMRDTGYRPNVAFGDGIKDIIASLRQEGTNTGGPAPANTDG